MTDKTLFEIIDQLAGQDETVKVSTTLGDLRRLVDLVRQEERRAGVFGATSGGNGGGFGIVVSSGCGGAGGTQDGPTNVAYTQGLGGGPASGTA